MVEMSEVTPLELTTVEGGLLMLPVLVGLGIAAAATACVAYLQQPKK